MQFNLTVRRRLAWLSLVVCLPVWNVGAQTAEQSLTLPLAVETALRTNPLTRATAAGREIADAQVSEARAGRFPLLQFNETLTRGNNPVFVFGSLLEQARFGAPDFALPALNNPGSLTNYRTSLSLRMPVFDQRQSRTRIAQAQFRQQQADAQSDQVRQQIRFETLKSFYGVLLAQAKKEVADEAVKLAEADIKRSRDRVEVGASVVADLLAAEVQLAEFQQQQLQAEGDIATAVAALNTALGVPINTPQQISGGLADKLFNVAAQDELIAQALQRRPDYARAGLALRERGQQVNGARGEFLPRLDVFTSAGLSSRNWWSGSSDYTVGASLTFNLFDAGRKARLAQAHATERLANSEQEHLANQIRLEVVRACQQFVTAQARLKVAERVISHATEALRIVQDRYREGLTTITEVLRAETTLVRAQTNVLAARYDYYVGYASVLLTSGGLTDVQAFVS
ncbi:MAG: TolC family protein [Blastocatellia bacterium]